MKTQIDARGLSCPQPVLMALDEMKKGYSEAIEVLVDTDTAKENVSRAAESQGWQVKNTQEQGDGYKLVLSKESF